MWRVAAATLSARATAVKQPAQFKNLRPCPGLGLTTQEKNPKIVRDESGEHYRTETANPIFVMLTKAWQ